MEHLKKAATCCLALMGVFSALPATLAAQEEYAGLDQTILSTQVVAQHRTLRIGQSLNRWLQPPALLELSAKPERRGSSASDDANAPLLLSALKVGVSGVPLGSLRPGEEATSSDISDVFLSVQQLAGKRFDLAENTNLYFGLGHEEHFGLLLKVNSR
jgi:hypothetical protein